MTLPTLSIIIPAKNEEASIGTLLADLRERYPEAELIVVNDGSTDNTADIAHRHHARVINHPYSKGNGAAVKSGARVATGEIFVFLDADGQHPPEHLPTMLAMIEQGHDMVVGARTRDSQASSGRAIANGLYNRLAGYMTGHPVLDLTSGFRVVKAVYFKEYLYLLPNGFSYPTTITMAFFRAGHSIAYTSYSAKQRNGKSHINILNDGFRFLIIIFKIGTLYSPLKLFTPVSLCFFTLALAYYFYTYITAGRFTNMSALLFVTSTLIFLIGLVSEQITTLMYKER